MTTQTTTNMVSAEQPRLPATLCLVSVNPAKNRYRFYRISRQRTLWDEEVLVQTWGRLGTDGRSRLCFLEADEEVQPTIAKLLRQRLRHGYQLTVSEGV